MATVTSHTPGNFSWIELVTTDQDGAKQFYSQLFGWEIDDQPMGPDVFYTMLKLKGQYVAALYGMDKSQKERGLHPHWNVYITVASADDAAAKAKSLGGTIVAEPFDVMDVGRMATVKDPAGAQIMLWEAKKHQGAGIVDEAGAICWFELNVHDVDAAKAFYTGLFGWTAGGSPEYTEWINGEKHIGGMMQIKPDWGPVPPTWTSYIMVDDCDATAAKATALGATIITGPDDIPNTGRFAIVKDPQGAVIAIYQPSRKG